jgi:hypothetical protein
VLYPDFRLKRSYDCKITVGGKSNDCQDHKKSVHFGALLALSMLASAVSAQSYPNGPVHIIVPYSAGGLAGALARTTTPAS